MEDGYVAVVALQGGDCSAVGVGDRVERLAGFHFVMDYGRLVLYAFDLRRFRRGRLAAGRLSLRRYALGLRMRRCDFGVMSAGRNRQVQGKNSAAAKAVAVQA